MNAIVYTRSIPGADDASGSCEAQAKICVKHAHKMGWSVAGVYEDPDRSGEDGCRPRLDAAIRSLKRGDMLLVYRWDCIARDLMLSLQYERQIENKGAHVVAVTGEIPDDNPNAESVRHILMAVAELERKMSELAHDDMKPPQKNRRKTTVKQLPYGWKVDPDDSRRIVANENERAIISKIVRMRNAGHPYTQIARHLNESATSVRNRTWSAKIVRSIYLRETAPAEG